MGFSSQEAGRSDARFLPFGHPRSAHAFSDLLPQFEIPVGVVVLDVPLQYYTYIGKDTTPIQVMIRAEVSRKRK